MLPTTISAMRRVAILSGLLSAIPDQASAADDPVIVGGTLAPDTSWPWQVELQRLGSFICGGSIVNHDWVVTAAHCVTQETPAGSWTVLPAAQFTVRAGHHKRSVPGPAVQVFDVSSIVVRPSYSATELSDDIALLQLSVPAAFTDHVKPIRPAPSSPSPHERGVSTGWGRVSGAAPTSDDLLQAVVPIEASDECSAHFADLWGATGFELDDSMLCAGVPTGEVGICKGDSGGPLVSPRADGGSGWELVGISSWVSASPVLCGSYSVFTRVSEFSSWIDSVAGPTPLLGDVDQSGCVDEQDVELLLASYGETPPSPSYDTNSDGSVGYSDYLDVLGAWGSCQ